VESNNNGRVIEDERSVTVCPYCGCTDVKEVEDDNTVRNAIDDSYDFVLGLYPCSWKKTYYVRLYHFYKNNKNSQIEDLEPIITNKMNSAKEVFEDFVNMYMDNMTFTGDKDFDFRFYEIDRTDNSAEKLVASIYVQCNEDTTYKLYDMEEY